MFKHLSPLLLAPLTVLLLVAGYAAVWFLGAENGREHIAAWVAAQRAEGWVITHGPGQVDGFPLRVRITLPDVHIERDGWAVDSDALTVAAYPWAVTDPVLHFTGRHRIAPPDRPAWTVEADTLALALGTTDGHLDAAALTVRALTARREGGTGEAIRVAALSAAATPLETDGAVDFKTPTYSLSVTGEAITLPAAVRAPLGQTISRLDLDATLHGAVPRGPLRDRVSQWSNDGGTIEVHRLYVTWDPLEANAAGTVALDAQLQPVAALSARLRGFFAAITELEDSRVIRGRDATMARVVLGTMAATDDSGRAVLNLPINVQNRTVSAGPVDLYTFPPLDWGGPPPPKVSADTIRPGFEIDRWGNVIRKD